jgi:putative transposase
VQTQKVIENDEMKAVVELLFDLVMLTYRFLKPGGKSWLIAEHLLVRQQLIALSRKRKRAPQLTRLDRVVFAVSSLFIRPTRLSKLAIVVAHSTLLKLHLALVNRKYSILFSNKSKNKPGPKGPSIELIDLIISIKMKNPRYGCPKIALLASNVLNIEISEDVVRRILKKHYRPNFDGQSPSWLSIIGNAKDTLWSMDLFRCESILMQTHWVMLVMDQYSRAIIGYATCSGDLSGEVVTRMFNEIKVGHASPKYLSTDHDPLFKCHRWESCLRLHDIEQIRSVPYTPVSHPFVERLIGTTRREYLDHVLFWNAADLERKLAAFAGYNNEGRVHYSLAGITPQEKRGKAGLDSIKLPNYSWKFYSNGMFQIPIPA